MKIYISTIFRVWTPTTNQNTIIYKTHILFWIITSLFSFYKQLPTRCVIIKYVIFKLLIFIPFWTERQEQNENSSHIHEKYSPHHLQIILPLSVAYTGTYQPFCVTLTIHPPPPPSGKKTLYTSVFPYHPLLHRFLRFWIASRISCHRLDVPRSVAVHQAETDSVLRTPEILSRPPVVNRKRKFF